MSLFLSKIYFRMVILWLPALRKPSQNPSQKARTQKALAAAASVNRGALGQCFCAFLWLLLPLLLLVSSHVSATSLACASDYVLESN